MESTRRGRAAPRRPLGILALDTLGAIRARPMLIEHAVRGALVDAMKWRLGGGEPPAENAFAFAAAAAARQAVARSNAQGPRTDAAAVGRAAAAAAVRLFRSPLGKRLMTLPRGRIERATANGGGAEVVIRDGDGRLHLITLSALRRPLDVSARARDVATRTPIAPQDRLAPVRIHVYSLATGIRHESTGWTVAPVAESRTA